MTKTPSAAGPPPAYPGCYIALLPADPPLMRDHCSLSPAGYGVSWIAPSVLHVTLCYLGWLTASQRSGVSAIVRDGARDAPAAVTLAGDLEVTGGELTRALIAPLSEDPALRRHQQQLSARIRALGISVAEGFRPHLTVARISPGALGDPTGWRVAPLRVPVRGQRLLESRPTARELR